jgi:hypothetical protein
MAEGYEVDPDQLGQLASRFAAFAGEFDALVTASQAISQDDEAYGILCSWIPAILEGRHEEFDELIAYGQENMTLLAEAIGETADDYEATDEDAANELKGIEEELNP